MSGTVEGGKRAAAAIKAKDPDFYRKIGKRGGSARRNVPTGFAAMSKDKVSAASKKGLSHRWGTADRSDERPAELREKRGNHDG